MSNEYKEENKANEKSLNMMDLDENLRKMIAQTIEQSVKLAVEDTVAVFSERINELENKLEQANERLSKQETEEAAEGTSGEIDVTEESLEVSSKDEKTMVEGSVTEETPIFEESTIAIEEPVTEEPVAEEPKATSSEKLGDDAIAALFAHMNASADAEVESEPEADIQVEEVASEIEVPIAEGIAVEELTIEEPATEEPIVEKPKPTSNEKLGDDAIAALFAQINAGTDTEVESESEFKPDIESETEIQIEEEAVVSETPIIEDTAVEEPKPTSSEKLGDDAIAALFAQMNASADVEVEPEPEANVQVEEPKQTSNEKLGEDAIAALFAQMNVGADVEVESETEVDVQVEEVIPESEEPNGEKIAVEEPIIEEPATEEPIVEGTKPTSNEKLGDDAIAALFAQMNASAETEAEADIQAEVEDDVTKFEEVTVEEPIAEEFVVKESIIEEPAVVETFVEESKPTSNEKLGDDAIAALFVQMNAGADTEAEPETTDNEAEETIQETVTSEVEKTEADEPQKTNEDDAEARLREIRALNSDGAANEKLSEDAIAALFAKMSGGGSEAELPAPEVREELPAPEAKPELPAPEQKAELPAPEEETKLLEETTSEEVATEGTVVDESEMEEPKATGGEKLGQDAIAALFAQMNADVSTPAEAEYNPTTEDVGTETVEEETISEIDSEVAIQEPIEVEQSEQTTEEPLEEMETQSTDPVAEPVTETTDEESATEPEVKEPAQNSIYHVDIDAAIAEAQAAEAAKLAAEEAEIAANADEESQVSLEDLEEMLEEIDADAEAERLAEEEEERIRRELERLAAEAEKANQPEEISLAAKLGWEDADDDDDILLEEVEPILTKREKQALKQAAKDAKRAKKTAIKNEIKKQKQEEKKAIKDEKRKKKNVKQRAKQTKKLAKKAEKKARGLEREPKEGGSVTILLATYNPTRSWLKAQLKSINEQTYEDIRLTVLDDCSEAVSVEDIEKIVQATITKFPYNIHRNETHLGREKTYETLTELGSGDYFAYCSQDDIWEPGKVKRCLVEMEEKQADMAFTDAAIINQKGEMLTDSITKVRKQYRYMTGAGIAHHILAENFISGSTMLIKAEKAKSAMPFCPHMKYDQYLAYSCAKDGNIAIVGRPMVHRRFEVNQMQQTSEEIARDTRSYIELRIDRALTALKWLEKEEDLTDEMREHLEDCILWFLMRKEILKKRPHMFKAIWLSREFGLRTVGFEYIASRFSDERCSKMLAWFERINHKMPKPKPSKDKKKSKKTKKVVEEEAL